MDAPQIDTPIRHDVYATDGVDGFAIMARAIRYTVSEMRDRRDVARQRYADACRIAGAEPTAEELMARREVSRYNAEIDAVHRIVSMTIVMMRGATGDAPQSWTHEQCKAFAADAGF